MRLDKFLKVSRIIKRRTMAKEVADQGRIQINDKEAKASSEVKLGDILTLRFGGNRIMTVRIEKLQETTKKEEATTMYTLISDVRAGDSEEE